MSHIPRAPNGHFYVHATVNGQLVRFMVDTGASSVALTEEDARRIGESFSKDRYETVGPARPGPVSGQMLRIDSIEIEGKRVSNVRGAVIQGLDISLLGQSLSVAHGLDRDDRRRDGDPAGWNETAIALSVAAPQARVRLRPVADTSFLSFLSGESR